MDMSSQHRIGDQLAQTDIEANRNNWRPDPLPESWTRTADSHQRALRTVQTRESEPETTSIDFMAGHCQHCAAIAESAAQAISSVLWEFMHLTTEFWHPSESHPPQRFKLHLWYGCLVLLNRPSKYLGYLESFFDRDHALPSTVRANLPSVYIRGFDGPSAYRTYPSGNELSEAYPPVRFRPTMAAESEQELVERWNANVIAKIASDWDRYLRLNAAICVISLASMQIPFISQTPVLMGNLFLVAAFSGLGCFSGWDRSLLDNMKNMRSIKQWEPLLLPSFDPAVIGNEFECLARPEIYAVKGVLFTCILFLQSPFAYYGYQFGFGEKAKGAFMVSWCIILGWGVVSVICGTRRLRAYGTTGG